MAVLRVLSHSCFAVVKVIQSHWNRAAKAELAVSGLYQNEGEEPGEQILLLPSYPFTHLAHSSSDYGNPLCCGNPLCVGARPRAAGGREKELKVGSHQGFCSEVIPVFAD